MTNQENPSIVGKTDRVTGRPANIYTPSEDLVDGSNVPPISGARLAHPLPDGVSDTFVRPCADCGKTVRVVGGQQEPHEHQTFGPLDRLAAFAWWQGHDAAMAVADAEQAELKAEVERLKRDRHEWYEMFKQANNWSWESESRVTSAEAALTSEREAHAGLRARLEALADRFERWPSSPSLSVAARHLRDALAAEPAAPVAAEEGGEQEVGEGTHRALAANCREGNACGA